MSGLELARGLASAKALVLGLARTLERLGVLEPDSRFAPREEWVRSRRQEAEARSQGLQSSTLIGYVSLSFFWMRPLVSLLMRLGWKTMRADSLLYFNRFV